MRIVQRDLQQIPETSNKGVMMTSAVPLDQTVQLKLSHLAQCLTPHWVAPAGPLQDPLGPMHAHGPVHLAGEALAVKA